MGPSAQELQRGAALLGSCCFLLCHEHCHQTPLQCSTTTTAKPSGIPRGLTSSTSRVGRHYGSAAHLPGCRESLTTIALLSLPCNKMGIPLPLHRVKFWSYL